MIIKSRYIESFIIRDLKVKMVFLGGARQVGKTTVARKLVSSNFKSHYYSWDKMESRRTALKGEWPIDADLIILDEFHKYSKWKSWIKGEFDTHRKRFSFFLTGSAEHNISPRREDSLQGRYHYYTLHPFSAPELSGMKPDFWPGDEPVFRTGIMKKDVELLMKFGGFPEPVIKQDSRFLRRWHNERIERFFKEDIQVLTMIKDFGSLTVLADMLPEKASSILSINSLSEDLQVNYRTVVNWIDVFEQFYYLFRIPPFQTKKIASVRKEKKLYLWDWSSIEDEGKRFENLVASQLLKFCNFLYEHDGHKVMLYFLRDSTGRETDFLVTLDDKPWFALEAKLSDTDISKNLLYFKEKLKIPFCYQVTLKGKKEFMKTGIFVLGAEKFLSAFV